MHQNVLIQIMYWIISRRQLQRDCVMHVVHVTDFYFKIRRINGIWKLVKKNQSEYRMVQNNAHCPLNCTLSSHWICKTCQRIIMSSHINIPAECAANNTQLFDVPVNLENLNTLGKH